MQIVYGGDRAFNALMQPHPTPEYQRQIFANEMQRFIDLTSQAPLNSIGQQFIQKVQNAYDYVNGSEAMRIARAAVAQVAHVFQEDNIRTITELTSIQNAAPVMQRWIMANPVVREKYQQQQCDGYNNSYIDYFPDTIGDKHYDYRRVMNHVVVEDETHGWVVKNYVDDLVEGDRELELFEKVHILNTWEIVQGFMQQGESDPTSVWNCKL